MHSCVYICIFLICTRFFFIIIKSSCYRVWNLNINFIHIIFLVFFLKYVYVWVRICWRRVLYFVSISAVLQFVCNVSEQKVIGEQHFCLALKVTLDETNSLQPLLVCWSDLVQLPLVSCFSNRKHSMNSLKLNQSEETCLPVHICLWPCCVGKR